MTKKDQIFNCLQCGECCRGEGGVYFETSELTGVAEFLGMSVDRLQETCLTVRNGRLYIKTGADGLCLFNRQVCGIHPVKPKPCRDWPFFRGNLIDPVSFEAAKNNCPGIDPEATFEEFRSYAAINYPKLTEEI
ncbi:MAG: YkgJ family cysteine cluster protein [Deltaproteobacteria bacterium]|nr:YkgJ family cysteine cluster protein [Deltaproteobacteria bacterium]